MTTGTFTRSALVSAAACTLLVSAACSSSSGGGPANSLTGTVAGDTFTPTSAIFGEPFNLDSAGTIQVAIGFLTDMDNACAELTAGRIHRNKHIFEFLLGDFSGTAVTPPAAPGVYTATTLSGTPPPNFILGAYLMLDNSCQTPSMATPPETTSGTVNLTAVDANHIAGHGENIGMTSGDSIGLKFDFQSCPALITALSSTSGGTCVD